MAIQLFSNFVPQNEWAFFLAVQLFEYQGDDASTRKVRELALCIWLEVTEDAFLEEVEILMRKLRIKNFNPSEVITAFQVKYPAPFAGNYYAVLQKAIKPAQIQARQLAYVLDFSTGPYRIFQLPTFLEERTILGELEFFLKFVEFPEPDFLKEVENLIKNLETFLVSEEDEEVSCLLFEFRKRFPKPFRADKDFLNALG